MLTAIIDYESGNLHSAHKAFERMARETDAGQVVVTADADVVARADRLVLPGDGAFPACMASLKGQSGVYAAIVEAVEVKARPFLGICVGMQLMATWGREYEDTAGLGWITGEVTRISPEDPGLKVPHGDHTYFVHSYQMNVSNSDQRLAHVDYAGDVTAVIGRDTMLGMQFHPEKSQTTGLRMIANFLSWRP